MILRSDYMEGRATHRQYYAQFVTETVRALVVFRIASREQLVASKDPHLNDIPLKRWDAAVCSLPRSCVDQLKQAGDWLSLGTGVCILKEAARQIVEGSCTSSEFG